MTFPKINKSQFFLLSILFFFTILGIFLRFYQLSVIPAAISYDELDHVVNGLGIRFTGKDFQGQNYFWELLPTATETYTAELSALWHAATPHFNQNLMIRARLPNALFGIVGAAAFGILAYQIFRSKMIAVLTTVAMIISPWNIFISRTAYEAPISLTWLICSLIFFWQSLETKTFSKKVILISITLITLGASFFSYHGYKILFPFIYTLFFLWHNKTSVKEIRDNLISFRNQIIPLVVVLIGWIIIFSLFYIRLSEGWYGGRADEISLLNTESLASEVNTKRRDSLDSPFKPIFINKATVLSDKIVKNFSSSFDPKLLFVSGFDGSHNIGLWEHGFLYFIQAPLIIIGLLYLYKQDSKTACFLLGLIVMSLLPVLIHTNTSVSLRSSLFIPSLIQLSTIGLSVFIWKKYPAKKFILALIFFSFLLSVVNFQHFYFVRFPIQTIDTTYFEQKLLSSYLSLQEENIPTKVISSQPFNSTRTFAYYADLIHPNTITGWQAQLYNPTQKTYKYKNIVFTNQCDLTKENFMQELIIVHHSMAHCELGQLYQASSTNPETVKDKPTVIILPSPKDNRHYFHIYNDTICQDYSIPSYISINDASLFATESLSKQIFCEQWTRKGD